jgi:hypothetical protein
VFFNKQIDFSNETVWQRQNGATRRTLVLINKIRGLGEADKIENAKVGFLNKGNHAFIFINPPDKGQHDDRILGIFLNSKYGYSVLEGEELYGNYSQGGPGNSCSQFGIYTPGTLIEVDTYKHRTTPRYYRLTETGWIEVPPHELAEPQFV